MAFATDPSERDKIDNALRLPGLKFPKDQPVIGKKDIDLMLALGAIDTRRLRAGKQLLVVKRLCILYHAVISVFREYPSRDINHARFYEVALLSISKKHREMTKYLTPESLRHVIDLYRKAFVRSGWKVIKKSDENSILEQMNILFGRDAAQPDGDGDGNGGQSSTAGKAILESTEGTTEVLDPIEPIGDRVKLEKLVKIWMAIRGEKRAETSPAAPEIADPVFPQQDPDESAHAYMLRIKGAFRKLREDKDDILHLVDKRSEMYSALSEKCDGLEETIKEKNRRIAELEQRLGAHGDN